MPSLGEAYISVHADTAPFQRELQAQVTKSTAAIEKAQNAPARTRAANPSNSDETKALQAQTAKNKLLYAADQQFKIAAAKEADEAIKRVNRDTAQQLQNDLNRQVAAEKAATQARESIRKQDTIDNNNAVAAYLDGVKEKNTAERAAYVEHNSRTRAAAAAEKELARAAKEADDNHRGLNDRLIALSSTLSRIGFTGQTRLVTLGATFGFPLATLAAFTAAATVAVGVVTIFGIKSADAARSATLQFQSLGLTAEQAKKQFADLQALSNKGLQISNLDKDASLLLQLGVNAKDTTEILKEFADIFSANGDTGATLQKDIDDTAKKFATLVNTAKITPRTFQTAVASLGIGVTAQAVFDQVKKNLDVTTKQLDDIIAKGKLSGSALASAALQAARPGTAGALSNAVATSPTQALEAAKSSAQSTLANAFGGAGTTIAGFIGQLSSQLDGFLAKFAPKVIHLITDVVPGLISAIKPFGDALVASLGLVEPLLKSIAPIVSHLSADVTNFFSAAKTDGSDTNQILGALNDVFHEVLDVIHAATPASEALADGLGTVLIVVGDLEPALHLLADVINTITDIPFAKTLITGAVLLTALATAVGIAQKVIVPLARGAAEAAGAITLMASAEGRATVGARVMTAANEALAVSNAEVAATAKTAAGAEGAAGVGGLATRAEGAAKKTGLLAGALNLAKGAIGVVGTALGLAAPEVVALGVATGIASYGVYKLSNSLTASALGNVKHIGKDAGDAALDLQSHFAYLDQAAKDLGLSAEFLEGKLSDAGLQAITTAAQAGTLGDAASAIVGQLEAGGDSADQASIALQAMGVNATDAANAVKGIDTTVASAQLHALADNALVAAGALAIAAAEGQEVYSAQHGGLVGPIPQALGVDAIAKARSGLGGLTAPTVPNPGTGTGGDTGTGDGGAKAAAAKIKSAFANLNDDLKAIADKTSEQSASQIKSEFKKLIKDLDDSGNDALIAGTKKIESKLLDRIKTLKPLQDKLAAELTLGQGVKDSVTGSGAIDGGQGIATTFTGIQNKLRVSASTAQAFITAIKKLQSEKLNRTSIKQLIDDYASDPSGALAAAQALVGAGQAGITGAGGINDLQGQLNALGNDLGNDTAGELYKQGQHVGDGLLEGLKSKEKDIEKEINKIADMMEKAMKKKIKAHSPSELYDDIGGDIGDGLVNGLHGSVSKVAAAAGNLGQTVINFGPGSVAVNNANPANPAGSGLMVGHGIVGVLQRSQTQAVLQGVG